MWGLRDIVICWMQLHCRGSFTLGHLLFVAGNNISCPCHRPTGNFVGLKNGGATCYMNAVFQQAFMQPSIRHLVLRAPESGDDAAQSNSVFWQLQVRRTVSRSD